VSEIPHAVVVDSPWPDDARGLDHPRGGGGRRRQPARTDSLGSGCTHWETDKSLSTSRTCSATPPPPGQRCKPDCAPTPTAGGRDKQRVRFREMASCPSAETMCAQWSLVSLGPARPGTDDVGCCSQITTWA
jgi:hypothetical protein